MTNVHSLGDLRQMQSLPLETKIAMSQRRIREWYEQWDGDVYISFSGGKDSTVLKHIVDNTPGVYDVPAVFVNTGLEYPEIQQFVRDVKAGKFSCFNSDVEILRPEMRFDEVIKKYGYPVASKEQALYVYECRNTKTEKLRHRRLYGDSRGYFKISKRWLPLVNAPFEVHSKCCTVMKKNPAKKYEKLTGRKAILGTMAEESIARKTVWMQYGCNAFEKDRPTSQPMSFWTNQDILHYIQKFDVPYCPVYGDIRVKQVVDNDAVFEGQMNMIDYLGCYDEADTLELTGCDRTGCIFCMFGCHLEKEPNRFQRLKQTHPRQYDFCINGGEMVDGKWQPSQEGLGLGKVLDYIGVDYK